MSIRAPLYLTLIFGLTPPPLSFALPQSSAVEEQEGNQDAKIYQVKQQDGSILYTDSPSTDATPLTFSSQTKNVVNHHEPALPAAQISADKQSSQSHYAVNIAFPAPDATVRDNSGNVTIRAIQPKRPFAPQYQLVLNGTIEATNTTGIFALQGLPRGAHNYQVKVINNKGKTLASSEVRTLFLHQASVLINNN
ncbi:DUF4124 domain-containing protein [Alteromonas sp. 345S023]|uniref:DUF4124 domain-containing protein n=1 Tax=Alteromonas profundi TaxID=2696062 RepID=A0A7X5RK33_9ALTE|nr:DUF4124 domain-containing protein [Alteromonas profundi]NDV90316.1 DUF4124 domain-containing protein [Alteromonas profundi]